MVLRFVRVASSRKHHLHDHGVRFPLLRRDGLGVEVKGDFRVGVTEKFLSDFNIDAQKPQIRPQRMPEGMPSNRLPANSGPLRSRANDLLEERVRPNGYLPVVANRRKEKIGIL